MAQLNRKPLSRKTIYALTAIVVIAVVSLAAFTFIWRMGNPVSKNGGVDVEITDFSLSDNWEPIGGLAFVLPFNVTVTNDGQTDVSDLVLKVRMFDNGTDTQVGNYFYDNHANGTQTYPIYENGSFAEPLKAREVRVFTGVMDSDASRIFYPTNTTITRQYEAVLILNNATLDEKWIR